MSPAIDIPREQIADFCRRYKIRRLALFGSVLRPDFRPDSDIDVLVEFEPDASVSFFQLARLQRELGGLFKGRSVDIRTPEELSRYFRHKVLSTAYAVYGRS